MNQVENGLYVSVNYTGTLANGEVFDSSQGRLPLEVQMGQGQLIKGFEAALAGMQLKEKKNFTLQPEEAYGARDESLVRDLPRNCVPDDMDPQVGQMVGMTTPKGQQIPATITHIDAEKITLDLNHPLAGEALTFDIEVVGISATPTQAAQGCGGGCDCGSAKESNCSPESGCGCSSGCH
jgi:peptidylprolyl isomerase